jgi:hypothetical protein
MPGTTGSGSKNYGSLNKNNKIERECWNIINNVILGMILFKNFTCRLPPGPVSGITAA